MKIPTSLLKSVCASVLLTAAALGTSSLAADVTNVLGRTGFEEATAGTNGYAGSITELSFSTLYITNAGTATTPNDNPGQVASTALTGGDAAATASLADANARKTGTKYYVTANRAITRQTEVTFGNVTISGYTNRTVSLKIFIGGTVAGNDYEGSGTTLDFVKGVLTFSDSTTQTLYDSQATAIDLDTLPFGLLKTNYATLTFSIPDGVTATSVRLKLTCTGNSSQAAESIAYDEIIFSGVAASSSPAVALTAPANGSSAFAPATINLTSTASGGSGSVSNVAYFYTNSGAVTIVGTSASGPTYPVSTAPLGAGSYGFYAITTNSSGATAVSQTNVVTVNAPLTSLTFIQQPSEQRAGVVISPEVQVGATNSLGGPMINVPVTLSLTGQGSLGGTLTQNTDGSGVAHFANLTVSAIGTKILTATNAGSGISGTSSSFSITNLPVIDVGGGGSGVITFTTLPPVEQWSSFSNPGAQNATRTDADWTTLVNVNNASAINTVLGSQAAPGSSGNAYWRNDIGRIATQPTGNAGTLLMATLRNVTGGTINTLDINYEMSETVTLTANEAHRGHRVYYSTSGLPNTWTFFGSIINLALSTNNVSFSFNSLGWTANTLLYVIWADENGVSPDGDWAIDNISFAPPTAVAASLVFEQQPSTARTGSIISPEVQVKALDGSANALSNAIVTVSLTGSGTLGGTVTAITDLGGIAHFANLTVSAPGVGNTLVATNLTGAIGVSSSAFNITNPPALASIAFQVQPSDTVVYATITPAVTVLALDVNSNPSPRVPVTISLVGAATLGGTLTQNTDASGVATFANLTVNATNTGYTLVATNAGSGLSSISSAFAITLPPPISVGLAGSGIQTFSIRPAASQWSTFGYPGAVNATRTEADWTSFVNSNAAGNITVELGSQAAPGPVGNAYWRSDIGRIATQPTGVAGTLLMATLTNTSGTTISTLDVAYQMADTIAVTEDHRGHRVYFSTTGLTNSWTFAGAVTNLALSTNNVNISLTSVGWVANSSLYIIWADENGISPDGDWSIDNIAFTIGASAQPVIGAPFYNVGTDQLTLTWSSVPGALYTIENTSTVELPLSWDNLFTNIASGGSATSFVITTPVPGTFYRIRKQ